MKINNDGNSAAAAADDVLQSWNCNNHLLNFV